MIVSLLRLLIAIVVAVFVGKLVSKVKLPSILGWLIAGMLLGPHAFALVNQDILDAAWYENSVHILECGVGLMIGTELVWNKIKNQKINYHYNFNTVSWYFLVCIPGVWCCLLYV